MANGRGTRRASLWFPPGEFSPPYAQLQLPHPLDFDWRFTESTVDGLWRLAHVLAHETETIALLGAPSLAKSLEENPNWNGPVLLFDKNAAGFKMVGGLVQEIEFDIHNDEPCRSNAALVFADPPWYEDELKSFLWCSAANCRVGGHIAISIPPLDTRPGIAQERARIEQIATECGLQLLRIFPATLRYETPFFEVNAMRAAGTYRSNNWRPGDLALYRRDGHSLGRRPVLSITEAWTERIFGSSRIRIKKNWQLRSGSPILQAIVPGDILPSVSRRDPRRARADVWTSGNRVFRCSGTGTLLQILDALIDQKDLERSIAQHLGQSLSQAERFRVHLAANQLLNVVKCESGEFRAHVSKLRVLRKLEPGSHPAIARKRAG